MSDFNAKMHQIRFWLGFRPRPRGKNFQRSMTPNWCGWGLAAPPLIAATEHTML